MQKMKQISAAVQRNAANNAARKAAKRRGQEIWESRQLQTRMRQREKAYVLDERKRRQEDWATGPRLAPRRDIGEAKEDYGTLDQVFNQPLTIYDRRGEKRPKCWLAEGDRVVLLDGKDKGRIGKIATLDEDARTVRVRGLNMVDLYVPEFFRLEDNDPRPIVPMASDLPWSAVKLVVPVPDEQGNFRDVIVDKVEFRAARRKDSLKPEAFRSEHIRVIPGLDYPIPWPEQEPVEYEDNDVDTLRITVDEVTDRPYLLQPPMPTTVIDELRNKYSRFRTRHSEEYVAQQEQKAMIARRKQGLLARTASTPMMEMTERNIASRARERKELTDEQLARIGEVMEREKAAAIQRMASSSASQSTS